MSKYPLGVLHLGDISMVELLDYGDTV